MNAGVYKATTGLLHQSLRMDALADNLANSNVPGYRRSVTSTRPFLGLLKASLGGDMPEDGTRVNRIAIDFTPGSLKQTDRPLDFAIEGDAFFVVKQGDKEYYTRNGSFTLDADGNLVTHSGLTVGGDITLPEDVSLQQLTVSHDGILRSGGRELGTLQIKTFSDPQRLQRAGPSLFSAPADLTPEDPGEQAKIVNRALESSNTSIFTEMTDMIACTRNYEACQRMLTIQDGMEGSMINKIV
ncbi:MAG: flagellar hook basal-body protein [Lentisphaerae bacterium]|nr:flagellar hook basal-body protein [Lentisphaerota bacterium]